MQAMTREARETKGVALTLATAGGSFLNRVNQGNLYVRTVPHTERTVSLSRLWDGLRRGDPGAAFLYDRTRGTARLLHRSRPWLDPTALAPMRPVSIRSRDGLTLRSYLTLPLEAQPTGLPTVLVVHGGPGSRDAWGYDAEAQFLANRGYAVLQVNYRGSRGFGKAFMHAAEREFAGRMHDDLIDAVRWAVGAGVADPARVAEFAAFVRRERGPAAVLVNNAGIARFAALAELALEDWDAVIATNLRSLYLVTRAFLADIVANAGAIVNMASLAGRNGFAGGTAYCASKHAVLGFSKALMFEVRKHDVRVIALCPGSVATPFMDKQERASRTPRERMLEAEDVAQTVVAALTLPGRAMVSELDIRPTNP